MSASLEIFNVVSPQARAFTRREHRRAGALDPRMLQAFLDEAVARYVASGGVSDLTDAIISDTKRSIARYCSAMPVKTYGEANRCLFAAMAPKAKAWAKADRRARRAPVDRDRLQAYLHREVSTYVLALGQDVPEADRQTVVQRLTAYFGAMRSVKPEPLRPASTVMARGLLEVDVRSTEAIEAERAERDGRAPRRLSIDALTDALAVELIRGPDGQPHARDTGVTRSAVRGAVERIHGQPLRAARIDRLPPTARDLAGVLEAELPQKRVSVVTVNALATKLWAPARTPAARRQHVRRLRVAGDLIAEAGIGLRIAVVGDHVVVGRGRVLPDGEAALKALVDAALVVRRQVGRDRVRRLSHGLVVHRQGVWATEEGEVAKAMARVVASQGGHDDAWVTLAAAGLTAGADDMSAVWDGAGPAVQADTLVLASAIQDAAGTKVYGRLTGQAPQAASLLRDLTTRAREAGLDQAWNNLIRSRGMEERLRRASEAGARERVRRIGAAFSKAPIPEAWEAAVLLSTCTVRPGRRHKHPVPMPVAKPTPAPVPAPAAATFVPSFQPDAKISLDLAEDIQIHWRVNKVRPSVQALYSCYLGLNIEDTRDLVLRDLPQPSTVDEVRAGLRRVLSWWSSPELDQVARIDAELKGSLRQAVLAASIALRDEGPAALSYAFGIVPTVINYLKTADGVRGLPGILAERAERHRWNMAQAASTAA